MRERLGQQLRVNRVTNLVYSNVPAGVCVFCSYIEDNWGLLYFSRGTATCVCEERWFACVLVYVSLGSESERRCSQTDNLYHVNICTSVVVQQRPVINVSIQHAWVRSQCTRARDCGVRAGDVPCRLGCKYNCSPGYHISVRTGFPVSPVRQQRLSRLTSSKTTLCVIYSPVLPTAPILPRHRYSPAVFCTYVCCMYVHQRRVAAEFFYDCHVRTFRISMIQSGDEGESNTASM